MNEFQTSKEWISDVKFSPSGQVFAVGSHDNRVYLYDAQGLVAQQKKRVGVCKGASSFVRHLDFSADGTKLQMTTGDHALLFCKPLRPTPLSPFPLDNIRLCLALPCFVPSSSHLVLPDDANSGQQIFERAVKGENWYTWTCHRGWPVEGMWQLSVDFTDINSVDRSHNEELLATADDFGDVRLFRYPCMDRKVRPKPVTPLTACGSLTSSLFAFGAALLSPCFGVCCSFVNSQAKSHFADGHSSHVTCVRFTNNDAYLLSTGGADRTLMQWRIKPKNGGDEDPWAGVPSTGGAGAGAGAGGRAAASGYESKDAEEGNEALQGFNEKVQQAMEKTASRLQADGGARSRGRKVGMSRAQAARNRGRKAPQLPPQRRR